MTPLSLNRGAVERYLSAHERAFPERGSSNYTIPHQVLRDYLDTIDAAKRVRPGLHNVTITVTKTPALGLIHPDILLDSDITVRVQGQTYP